MRFPFVSRRRAEASVAVATAAVWHMVDAADDRTTAELGARLDAEHALVDARRELAQERAKRERLKAYMAGAHTGRYETRLARALRAVARLRAEAAVQQRVTNRLANQLLDATGNQAAPLTDAARTALGLDHEVTK